LSLVVPGPVAAPLEMIHGVADKTIGVLVFVPLKIV
jgi:hypothetical protein